MSKQTPSIEAGKRVLRIEADALTALEQALDGAFDTAVGRIAEAKGRAVLAGIGKSGHVARKIAATMASTGTPALYVHPTEASHGDMGMITPDDVVIALSRSGETQELSDLIGYCRRFAIPLIAITAVGESTLGRAADIALVLPNAPEACAETKAPTTSTTLQIALGDALAVALLERQGFTAEHFRQFHPGRALGARLMRVGDLMHAGEEMPLTGADTPMSEALIAMSEKGFGAVGVTGPDGKLAGIITDGDLRRHMGGGLLDQPASAVMTANPITTEPGVLAADALRRMTAQSPRITVLFALEDGKPAGILHIHDLLRAGIA